jgi:hypothetical protein
MKKISIFDWNGTLLQEVLEDEKNFEISLRQLAGKGIMGFEVFEISGKEEQIQKFLDFYELELD